MHELFTLINFAPLGDFLILWNQYMAKQSKFTDEQINSILADLVAVLEKHRADVPLALVVLGNMTTHLLSSLNEPKQQAMAQAFCDALMRSLKSPTSHKMN